MHIEGRCKSCGSATFIRLALGPDGESLGTIANQLFPPEPDRAPASAEYLALYAKVLQDILDHSGGCNICEGEVDVIVVGDN